MSYFLHPSFFKINNRVDTFELMVLVRFLIPRRMAMYIPQGAARPARTVHVVALGTGPESRTVRSMSWNGEALAGGGSIEDSTIQTGGTLRFVFDSEPSPELSYDADSASSAVASSASSSSSSKEVMGIFSRDPANANDGSDSREENKNQESLEELKREAAAARANLKEQVDTYASAAENAAEKLRVAQLELDKERQSRLQEVTSLQTALKDQAREISDYETTIATLTTKAAAGERAVAEGASEGAAASAAAEAAVTIGAASAAAIAQEVKALRASVDVEKKEHDRTKVMQKMLEDQIRRASELRTLSNTIQHKVGIAKDTPAIDEPKEGPYVLSSDWLQRLLVISGVLMALGAWVQLSSSDQPGASSGGLPAFGTSRKASQHIV